MEKAKVEFEGRYIMLSAGTNVYDGCINAPFVPTDATRKKYPFSSSNFPPKRVHRKPQIITLLKFILFSSKTIKIRHGVRSSLPMVFNFLHNRRGTKAFWANFLRLMKLHPWELFKFLFYKIYFATREFGKI